MKKNRMLKFNCLLVVFMMLFTTTTTFATPSESLEADIHEKSSEKMDIRTQQYTQILNELWTENVEYEDIRGEYFDRMRAVTPSNVRIFTSIDEMLKVYEIEVELAKINLKGAEVNLKAHKEGITNPVELQNLSAEIKEINQKISEFWVGDVKNYSKNKHEEEVSLEESRAKAKAESDALWQKFFQILKEIEAEKQELGIENVEYKDIRDEAFDRLKEFTPSNIRIFAGKDDMIKDYEKQVEIAEINLESAELNLKTLINNLKIIEEKTLSVTASASHSHGGQLVDAIYTVSYSSSESGCIASVYIDYIYACNICGERWVGSSSFQYSVIESHSMGWDAQAGKLRCGKCGYTT